jgi:cytidyltransferase-like protein
MKRVILSGYFNPLHGGHLDMIEAGTRMGDYLIVIVNNDVAQRYKKGTIILNEQNRVRLISALRDVDEVFLSIDQDLAQCESLRSLAKKYPDDELTFGNGGDRSPHGDPPPEVAVCEELGIKMVYGVGGDTKSDSSTRINQALGHPLVAPQYGQASRSALLGPMTHD